MRDEKDEEEEKNRKSHRPISMCFIRESKSDHLGIWVSKCLSVYPMPRRMERERERERLNSQANNKQQTATRLVKVD